MSVAQRIAGWHSGRTWVVEPHVADIPPQLAERATLVSLADALQHADILVMLVDHAQFRAVTPEQVTQSWIVDTKGVWR